MDNSENNDIVAIDKPVGLTSHDVVNRIRHITGELRVGHAGTLDPLASGVLLVLIGRENTRRQAEFMDLPKIYKAELTFGSTSATDDAEGPVTQRATIEQLQALTVADVEALLPQFTGSIQQRPPIHSAIKVAGTPLYKRARRGTVTAEEVAPRTVQIDRIELLQFVPATPPFPPTARIRVHCHKGTYIRSIARDMGEALGTGAYLSALRRTAIGPYTINTASSLEAFEKTWNNGQR